MGVGTEPFGFSDDTMTFDDTDKVAISCIRDSKVVLLSELSVWRVTENNEKLIEENLSEVSMDIQETISYINVKS